MAGRPERVAGGTMAGLLVLAAKGHEAPRAAELEALIDLGALPDLAAIETMLVPPRTAVPTVSVMLPELAVYDAMLGARA